jgi:hypothetical protein
LIEYPSVLETESTEDTEILTNDTENEETTEIQFTSEITTITDTTTGKITNENNSS